MGIYDLASYVPNELKGINVNDMIAHAQRKDYT